MLYRGEATQMAFRGGGASEGRQRQQVGGGGRGSRARARDDAGPGLRAKALWAEEETPCTAHPLDKLPWHFLRPEERGREASQRAAEMVTQWTNCQAEAHRTSLGAEKTKGSRYEWNNCGVRTFGLPGEGASSPKIAFDPVLAT